LLSEWNSASWQIRVQEYSCTCLFHSTKIDIPNWILHFASYTFVDEELSSYDCSLFSHDISLNEIDVQATYRTWWKHMYSICTTFACFPYSSLFPLQWESLTPFQPNLLTSVLADSIQKCLVRHSQSGALGFHSLDDIAQLYIGIIVCLTVVSAYAWIIKITFPLKPTVSEGNVFLYAILVTIGWMTVDCSESGDIQYCSLSSWEVHCRQSWWQRWFSWQFKICCNIMVEIIPGCIDDHFGIWNVTYGCQWLVLSTRFYLCCT